MTDVAETRGRKFGDSAGRKGSRVWPGITLLSHPFRIKQDVANSWQGVYQ